MESQRSADSLITRDIANDLESIERDAWLDIFSAAPKSYVEASGLNYKRLNDAAGLANRGVPIAEFNRVFSLGLEKPASASAFDNAVSWLGSNASSGWAVQLSPLALPEALSDWLREHGLRRSGTGWAKFYRPASKLKMKPRASTLETRRIDKALALDFGRVVQSGFGLPESTAAWFAALVGRIGWNAYLAFDDASPVAAGAMYTKGKWAWLGIDATLTDARGQGAQSALIEQRLKDGLSSRVVGFTAETGCPPTGQEGAYHSYRNYRWGQFTVAYVRHNYKRLTVSADVGASGREHGKGRS